MELSYEEIKHAYGYIRVSSTYLGVCEYISNLKNNADRPYKTSIIECIN